MNQITWIHFNETSYINPFQWISSYWFVLINLCESVLWEPLLYLYFYPKLFYTFYRRELRRKIMHLSAHFPILRSRALNFYNNWNLYNDWYLYDHWKLYTKNNALTHFFQARQYYGCSQAASSLESYHKI